MHEEELPKQESAALHLPSKNPFDGDELIWSPRLAEPSDTEFQDEQRAA